MRVLHVITRLVVGGAQENTIATVLGLRERGVDVRLLSGPTTGPEGSLEPVIARAGLLTLVPSLIRAVRPITDWRAYCDLLRLFRQDRPRLVHTHSGKAGILGRLAAARAGVPGIVHTIHGPSFGAFQGRLPNLIFRAAERRAGRVTTHFISVADAMTQQYLAAGIGHPGQYTTIRSGFDLEPFLQARNDPALRRELGLAPDDFVVGKIARLFELKGHDDLFVIAPELVRAQPRTRFMFVGDGAWRERFEQRAAALGLRERFIFTGLVPPAAVPRYVGLMDALVHLSVREGLPRSLPQAMATGKPVVAYDCDGAREVCRDGETGFLLRAGDHAGLLRRLQTLAAQPALCAQLGESGRALVRDQFPVARMVEAIHALYLDLTRQSYSPAPTR
jgi:glycosyltransferase involved in cell wall biosynthesis